MCFLNLFIFYQTCSLTFFPSTSIVFTLKSIPRKKGEKEMDKQEGQEGRVDIF